jgi:hypothetical protein
MVAAMAQRRTSSPKHLTAPTRPFMEGETSDQGRPMPRRTAATGTMIDRIGRAIAAADNGDFEADKARYRGLASVALKPLTRPCEAMVDAAYQAVSFDGYWAINSRSDFKKAAKAMITFAMREYEG